jgi:prepilin signal peptidase PulO-like enzyme (type II secretory pathway)
MKNQIKKTINIKYLIAFISIYILFFLLLLYIKGLSFKTILYPILISVSFVLTRLILTGDLIKIIKIINKHGKK